MEIYIYFKKRLINTLRRAIPELIFFNIQRLTFYFFLPLKNSVRLILYGFVMLFYLISSIIYWHDIYI